jgi:hypothetical protein
MTVAPMPWSARRMATSSPISAIGQP